MSGTLNKAIKYSFGACCVVYLVSSFTGPAETARFVVHTVQGLAVSAGMLSGTLPEVGPGVQEGQNLAKVAAKP